MGWSSNSDKERESLAFPPRSHRALASGGEWEMVQELLRSAPSPIAREFLLHYYISAKTWPLVLVIGRPGVGKRRLFYLLATGIAGGAGGRILLLPVQSSWQEHTGQAGYLGSMQGRFNTMAFLDLLAEATMPGNEGQAYFLALDRATPAELSEYMDLYLTSHPDGEGPPPLPPNLYLTATLSIAGGTWCLPLALLDRVGIVEVAVPLGEESPTPPACPPVGWQRLFLRSTVRDPEQARRRLQGLGVLPEFYRSLAALQAGMAGTMGPEMEEGLLFYVANSFTAEGEGLLDVAHLANLRQAIDLQLAQRLLPCLAQRPSWTQEDWSRLLAQLEGAFPQGHARARRILLGKSFSTGGAAETASVPSADSAVTESTVPSAHLHPPR